MATPRKCLYKTKKRGRCGNTAPLDGRYGGYCYAHRNHSWAYIQAGGSSSIIPDATVKTIGNTGKMYVSKGKARDISCQLSPVAHHASMLHSGLDMSKGLSGKVAWSVSKLDDSRDTNPRYVRDHSAERFDRLGAALVKSGIQKNRIGIMKVSGLTITPFSDTIERKGEPRKFPDMSHHCIAVHDYDPKTNQDSVFVLDPNIAMFAPVGSDSEDIDVRELPPESTPYSDGVYVAPSGNYFHSPHMHWDKFKPVWFEDEGE